MAGRTSAALNHHYIVQMSLQSRVAVGKLLGLLLLGSAGCSLRLSTVVESFKGEFSCAKNQIHVERPDKSQPNFYRADGCNRRASYRCTGDYGELCERIGEPEHIKPEAGTVDFSTH